MKSVVNKKPITAVIVGAGHRSLIYASYSNDFPDQLKITGVAEPDEFRRKQTAEMYNIPLQYCFESAEELASYPKFADAAINGTMDMDHIKTTIPILKAGYDVLLEKPICTDETDLFRLLQTVRETGRTVIISHILRYFPFYAAIYKKIAAGEIGNILNIQSAEHVSYHHMSVAFVRDKWNNKEKCGSSMLMQKCCHDIDMITWMKSGIRPVKVSSFGGLSYFTKDNAPKESGTRCLVDCPIEKDCLYSARKIYLDHPNRWDFYVWRFLEHINNPTIKQKEKSLKTDNPHGRCVWKCENDVVDHQSVVIEFEDASTATFNLVGGTTRDYRKLHIVGTEGEIVGPTENRGFIIRHADPSPSNKRGYNEEEIPVTPPPLKISKGEHPGDLLLIKDFINVLNGNEPSISTTRLEDSIYGHLTAFRADKAMEKNKLMEINRL